MKAEYMKKTMIRCGYFDVPARLATENDVLPPLAPELTPRAYKVYPYALQELYAEKHEVKSFRTLELENDFLHIRVLPELGGRLLAFDKKANRELFFRNTELTPVMAGLTGAWMRLGCEFNFPGSHSVTSNREISASVQENPDGSASILFGDVESCSGMEWQIELRLAPNSAVIEQRSRYFNRSEYCNRGYFWTNAKVEAPEDSEFIFPPLQDEGMIHPPMDVTRIHCFKLPGDNGVDLRENRNIVYPLPLFFKDLRTPFFGCREKKADAGIIHYAACGDLPGRKIWTPGVGEDAKPTAQGGPDTFEIQSGPLPLQTDFFYMEPGTCAEWTEYWLPFHGIGMVRNASPECMIGEKDGKFYLLALQELHNVTVGNVTAEILKTGEVLPLTEIKSVFGDGREILPELKRDPVLPEYAPNDGHLEESSDEVLLQKARYQFSRGANVLACDYCRKVLSHDRENSEATLLLGIDALKRGKSLEAESYLAIARKRNRRNSRIDYYLGLALFRNGKLQEGEFYLERALPSAEMRLPAVKQLAELLIASGRPAEADARLRSAVCGRDGRLCVRLENLPIIEFLLARHPEDAELRNAVNLLSPDQDAAQTEAGKFAGDSRRMLHRILDRIRWGAEVESWKKEYLRRFPEEPIGLFLFGGESEIAKAETIDSAGVFPDSTEVFSLLNEVYKKHPDSRILPYYLGVLAASFEDWQEAERFWKASGTVYALRGLGLSALHRNDPAEAAAWYMKGVEQAKGCVPYKYVYETSLALRRSGDTVQRKRLFAMIPKDLLSYPQIMLAQMQYEYDLGHDETLLEQLTHGKFTLFEGKRDTVNLFIGSHLRLGDKAFADGDYKSALEHFREAMRYPLNLGVGRTVGRADMATKLRICRTLAAMGEPEKAKSAAQEYIEEVERYSYQYVPLQTIRYEEDMLSEDRLLKENIDAEKELREIAKS